MTIVAAKSFRGRYTLENHIGVRFCAWYWHFVDVIWLVVFASLLLAG